MCVHWKCAVKPKKKSKENIKIDTDNIASEWVMCCSNWKWNDQNRVQQLRARRKWKKERATIFREYARDEQQLKQ